MKNEDKAKEIALRLFDDGHFYHNGISQRKEIEKAILQMAEWKDEQAKRQFIDKAVRWLKDNALHYCYKSAFTGDAMIDINRLAERFEIAMQEK